MTSLQMQEIETEPNCNTNLPSNSSNNKSLYICRRIQVLKDTERKPEKWKNYLKMRSMLLKQRCGSTLSNGVESNGFSKIFSKINLSNEPKYCDKSCTKPIVATKEAKASRAIVGGNSIIENYAFVGVHHIFDQHKDSVTMVKFANNDSSKLCCSSVDGLLTICDVTSDPPKVLSFLEGHLDTVTGFDWSENNDLIASSSLDSTVKFWNVAEAKCLSTVRDLTDAQVLCCLFQPSNNNLLIVGNSIGDLRVINISTGRYTKEVCKIGGNLISLSCDVRGTLLWVGNEKGEIVSVKYHADGKLIKSKRLAIPLPCSVTCLSYRVWISREARDPILLASCTNNSLCLFSIVDDQGTLSLKRVFHNLHEKYGVKSTFCPLISFRQGACVVTGSEDGNVYFFDVEKPSSRACINALQGHSKPVLGVSFNCNESLLATSDTDGLVIVWKRADIPQKETES